MSNTIMYNEAKTYSQSDSPITITIPTDASAHQITFDPVTATSGTAVVSFVPVGVSGSESLKDQYGAAITFNAATGQVSYEFGGRISAIVVTSTAMNGTFRISMSGVVA